MPPAAPAAQTPPPAPAGAGILRFNPPQADVASSANFALQLLLDNATDVTAAPIQINFDPRLLRLNDVTAGSLMGADGQQPVFSKNIQNEAGQATIQLNRAPGAPGITAPTGVLLYLNFQAVGHGATVISAPNASVRNSQGQTVASGNPQMTVNIK